MNRDPQKLFRGDRDPQKYFRGKQKKNILSEAVATYGCL
jgi:hypothetical protein